MAADDAERGSTHSIDSHQLAVIAAHFHLTAILMPPLRCRNEVLWAMRRQSVRERVMAREGSYVLLSFLLSNSESEMRCNLFQVERKESSLFRVHSQWVI